MHVKALLYFQVLARTGSLRRAAQKLDITPTALTRQIENLEHFFGAPLIEREQQGVRLTAAGEVVAERAGLVARELDSLRARVDDLKGLRSGTVTIRASGSPVSSVLAPALAALHQEFPGLRFNVETAGGPSIGAALTSGEVDLGLTLFAPSLSELTICSRLHVVHSAIMAPSHPLAGRRELFLEDVRAHALSIPDCSYFVRRAFDRVIPPNEAGFDPIFMTGSFELQLDLAMRGSAVLFLPEICCRTPIERNLLRAVPLAGPLQVPTALDLLRATNRPLSFAARMVANRIGRIMTTFA
ncbi:LysR family transcriptional regulator [Gluconacetobacter azotocaptans]|uniref:LysR family transcriptional regulator n=1 Tax=Gluconacetobacter azotocaptans TaxID=142834 RepID=A0A7W4JSP2_9PROT|nr:LysR family transcriptional regulator [Gluconacetobacter azotocaptans]MBB2190165.1 LysR family transcriptional regulator [Gluconacetobacter azotocaptans]MBM9403046.1 LysR family transcriptional regulator [Gluconacetobacter azotocaptans]GBQ27221.1 LysR family transcriptional regulator [Gluconacetobacter azotocaptans DSM 13594]